MVECDLAKVEVAGSNPVSRSRFLKGCRQNKVTALNHEGCESTGSLGCTPFHGRLKRLTSNRYNELLQKAGRGTQVAKGEVCKTFIRRFDSDPRLQSFLVVAYLAFS